MRRVGGLPSRGGDRGVAQLSISPTCLNSPRVATVFDFSAFGRARGTCPASLRADRAAAGEALPPPPGGGGFGDREGTGWVRPPARPAPGSSAPGDAVSGSRAAFKKLNTIFGNPPVGMLPPHAAQYPLPSPFSFLPPPLPPPAPSSSHPSAFNPFPARERDREEKMKCLFLCPNLRAPVWARSERLPRAPRLSREGPTARGGREMGWGGGEIPPSRAWPVFPLGEYFSASVRGFRTSDPRLPRPEWAGICPLTLPRVSQRSSCASAQGAWRWGVIA